MQHRALILLCLGNATRLTNVVLGIESSDVDFMIKSCADEISQPVLRYITLSLLLPMFWLSLFPRQDSSTN
jgi:hypothetical protein